MDVDCDNEERRKAKRSTQEQVDWWRQTLAPGQRPTDVEGVEVEDPAETRSDKWTSEQTATLGGLIRRVGPGVGAK